MGEQAARLEEQVKADAGATEAMAGAAGAYAALGDLGKSADLLQQLTSAWQALVSPSMGPHPQ